MQTEIYTVIDYEEINALISAQFGWGAASDPYNIVTDLIDDNRWQNDTDHSVTVEKDDAYDASCMAEEVAGIAVDGQIKYAYRLGSVLRLLMMENKIPWGKVLIQVSW
jgi:hypothetical protein